MIAFRLGSGRPRPGSNCVVMVSTTPLGCICPHQFDETSHRTVRLAHRFTFRAPHIRRAYVVVLLRRTHHPANRKAQKAPGSNINEKESYMNASTIDTTLTPATPAVGHYLPHRPELHNGAVLHPAPARLRDRLGHGQIRSDLP